MATGAGAPRAAAPGGPARAPRACPSSRGTRGGRGPGRVLGGVIWGGSSKLAMRRIARDHGRVHLPGELWGGPSSGAVGGRKRLGPKSTGGRPKFGRHRPRRARLPAQCAPLAVAGPTDKVRSPSGRSAMAPAALILADPGQSLSESPFFRPLFYASLAELPPSSQKNQDLGARNQCCLYPPRPGACPKRARRLLRGRCLCRECRVRKGSLDTVRKCSGGRTARAEVCMCLHRYDTGGLQREREREPTERQARGPRPGLLELPVEAHPLLRAPAGELTPSSAALSQRPPEWRSRCGGLSSAAGQRWLRAYASVSEGSIGPRRRKTRPG